MPESERTVTPDLLDALVAELGKLLAPLRDAIEDPRVLGGLLAQIGATREDAGGDALANALASLVDLAEQIEQLSAQPLPSFAGIDAVLAASRKAFTALRGLSAAGGAAQALEGLGIDLADLLILLYLWNWHRLSYKLAVLATLIQPANEAKPHEPVIRGDTVLRAPFQLDQFRLRRLSDLLRDPGGTLRVEYETPLASVDHVNAMADKLFPRVRDVLRELGVSCRYGFDPADAPLLGDSAPIVDRALIVYLSDPLLGAEVEAGVVLTLSSADRGDLGLVVIPFGTLTKSWAAGNWDIEIDFTADVQGFAYGRHGITILASPGTAEVGAKVKATLPPPDDGPAFLIGSPTSSHLEIAGADVAFQTTLSEAHQSFAVSADVVKSALVIASGDGDGFLSSILPADGLRAEFDLGLAWSNERGLTLRGSAGLDAILPIGRSIGGVTLSIVHLSLQANDASMVGEVSTTVAASIGPVDVIVDRVGIATVVTFPEEGGNLGVADFQVGFKPPTGLGLGIVAPVVSGGGNLSWDGGRYAGALHVKIADLIDLAAFGVLQTGSATQHWSLLVILAGHIPPIELGWNFRLTGLGGLLALHRGMDTDALRDAAYGIRGSLDDLLFPDSPETRLPQLLSTIERFFPPQTGSDVAGPMAEIEWGRGGVVNARVRAALLLQLDGSRVALYGTVRIGFPSIDADSTLRIRAGLEALFDARDQLARFSITILEAKLFQSIQFTGGAAFFVRWGSGRVLAFTIGGFHPAFRPYIPVGLIEPPRLGVHWNPVSGVRLDLTQYFAITTTSMQFGATAHAEVGCSWGKVTGDLAFDLLVMGSPALHLEADLHARVTVSVFGADLLSAGLDGSLVGPGPWVLAGKVTWKIWIFHISRSVQFEWGARTSIAGTVQSAGQLLGDEMQAVGNWTSFRTRRLPVKVRSGVAAPLAPRDELEVRQSRLPFNTRVEVMEGSPLSDPGVWTLTCTGASGLVTLFELTDVFPERRFVAEPSKERPFRGGLSCGARLGRADWDISTVAIAVDSTATDDVVVDGGQTVAGAVALPPVRAADAVTSALSTTASARAFDRGALEVVS